ncbi:DUF6234 family protein [Streptomyces hundungensis]|uniref:DUF6234 family protein n=1 Tax=Streptomyces hundungensis TaxID=1077946 RepID=UPI0033EFBE83
MSDLPSAPPVKRADYWDVPDRLHRGADTAIGCVLVLLELVALAICVVAWPFVDHFELDPQAPYRPYVFWDYAPAIAGVGAVVVVIGVVAAKGRATITALSQLLMALLVGAVLVFGSVEQQHDDGKMRSAPAPASRLPAACALATRPLSSINALGSRRGGGRSAEVVGRMVCGPRAWRRIGGSADAASLVIAARAVHAAPNTTTELWPPNPKFCLMATSMVAGRPTIGV